MNLRSATFTPEMGFELLHAACRAAGLDPSDAHLLRHHTNAVYRLAHHPVVVKITRPGSGRDRSTRSVAVAEVLTRTGVPTVQLWPSLNQPLAVADSYATFWMAVDATRGPVAADLAKPLHRLHDLDPEVLPALPELDPFGAIADSLTRPTVLDSDDLGFLQDYAGQLAEDYATLDFERPSCLIHGDAHHSNMLVGPNGPVLADWESARLGPPEWDLVTVAVHCRRFDHPLGEYEEFATRYGRDIRAWPGYRVLAAVRELRMITTNSWKSASGTPAAEEVLHRTAALRRGDDERIWRLL
ncbi:Ser/Thr protein kinase RdoA (MazF antagonist) [Catenulispora sp. GAS73]|uniref:phosphotransferase family protein n=1 Tax=Catenulispora sp. GAS73 TaxID=3156269 RepID=UPI003517308D